MQDMTTPGDYLRRAGNRPRPADWQEPVPDTHLTLAALQSSQYEVFADVAEFQPPYDDRYPYPIASFRLDNGWRLDKNAAANWAWARPALATGRLSLLVVYLVFIPGQSPAQLRRLKAFFGTSAPAGVAVEPDMESGHDFAGPGDHSIEANWLITQLAAWTGTPMLEREMAYANLGDFQACWPVLDAHLKRNVANYANTNPGGYAQQYYGGLPNLPSPSGLPRTCAPFGGYVDLNVIRRPLAQILADFAIAPPAPPTPPPLPGVQEDGMPYIVFKASSPATAWLVHYGGHAQPLLDADTTRAVRRNGASTFPIADADWDNTLRAIGAK